MTIVRFRVDASFEIGLGHFSRCIALAKGFERAGCQIRFYMREVPGRARSTLDHEGYYLRQMSGRSGEFSCGPYAHSHWLRGSEEGDAQAFLTIVSEEEYATKASITVVDHYGIGDPWEHAVAAFGPVLVIDDLNDRSHSCKWLLDQTYGKKNGDYANFVPVESRLLLGSDYALLRDEFSQARSRALEKRASIKKATNLLVAMGGADASNQAAEILQALHGYEHEMAVKIVVGAASDQFEMLQMLAKSARQRCEILYDISNMADLMIWADICVGAGGTTTWERCALGLPSIAICVAENQKEIIRKLTEVGAQVEINSVSQADTTALLESLELIQLNPKVYRRMSQAAAQICDGKGVERTVATVLGDFDD